jgi:glyoxylase-like metal-dependent hydrolase (beta-lactamase superfamily II)
VQQLFDRLQLRVFERGWLSSNNILFDAFDAPPTLVDTGYSIHAEQTVALVESALGAAPLERVINTHLHSDHCGGNAALCARWGCEIIVPRASFDAVREWQGERLTFAAIDQRCDRFPAHGTIAPGDEVLLSHTRWQVHATGGHDPDAVVLFQPDTRVLISGDALWRDRVAIIFPELLGEPGFDAALETLDLIQTLRPVAVIPGHGAAFDDVQSAIDRSRQRIQAFAREPVRHWQYASRALLMFHMLEHRRRRRDELVAWAHAVPMLRHPDPGWPDQALDRLLADGILQRQGDWIISAA